MSHNRRAFQPGGRTSTLDADSDNWRERDASTLLLDSLPTYAKKTLLCDKKVRLQYIDYLQYCVKELSESFIDCPGPYFDLIKSTKPDDTPIEETPKDDFADDPNDSHALATTSTATTGNTSITGDIATTHPSNRPKTFRSVTTTSQSFSYTEHPDGRKEYGPPELSQPTTVVEEINLTDTDTIAAAASRRSQLFTFQRIVGYISSKIKYSKERYDNDDNHNFSLDGLLDRYLPSLRRQMSYEHRLLSLTFDEAQFSCMKKDLIEKLEQYGLPVHNKTYFPLLRPMTAYFANVFPNGKSWFSSLMCYISILHFGPRGGCLFYQTWSSIESVRRYSHPENGQMCEEVAISFDHYKGFNELVKTHYKLLAYLDMQPDHPQYLLCQPCPIFWLNTLIKEKSGGLNLYEFLEDKKANGTTYNELKDMHIFSSTKENSYTDSFLDQEKRAMSLSITYNQHLRDVAMYCGIDPEIAHQMTLHQSIRRGTQIESQVQVDRNRLPDHSHNYNMGWHPNSSIGSRQYDPSLSSQLHNYANTMFSLLQSDLPTHVTLQSYMAGKVSKFDHSHLVHYLQSSLNLLQSKLVTSIVPDGKHYSDHNADLLCKIIHSFQDNDTLLFPNKKCFDRGEDMKHCIVLAAHHIQNKPSSSPPLLTDYDMSKRYLLSQIMYMRRDHMGEFLHETLRPFSSIHLSWKEKKDLHYKPRSKSSMPMVEKMDLISPFVGMFNMPRTDNASLDIPGLSIRDPHMDEKKRKAVEDDLASHGSPVILPLMHSRPKVPSSTIIQIMDDEIEVDITPFSTLAGDAKFVDVGTSVFPLRALCQQVTIDVDLLHRVNVDSSFGNSLKLQATSDASSLDNTLTDRRNSTDIQPNKEGISKLATSHPLSKTTMVTMEMHDSDSELKECVAKASTKSSTPSQLLIANSSVRRAVIAPIIPPTIGTESDLLRRPKKTDKEIMVAIHTVNTFKLEKLFHSVTRIQESLPFIPIESFSNKQKQTSMWNILSYELYGSSLHGEYLYDRSIANKFADSLIQMKMEHLLTPTELKTYEEALKLRQSSTTGANGVISNIHLTEWDENEIRIFLQAFPNTRSLQGWCHVIRAFCPTVLLGGYDNQQIKNKVRNFELYDDAKAARRKLTPKRIRQTHLRGRNPSSSTATTTTTSSTIVRPKASYLIGEAYNKSRQHLQLVGAAATCSSVDRPLSSSIANSVGTSLPAPTTPVIPPHLDMSIMDRRALSCQKEKSINNSHHNNDDNSGSSPAKKKARLGQPSMISKDDGLITSNLDPSNVVINMLDDTDDSNCTVYVNNDSLPAVKATVTPGSTDFNKKITILQPMSTSLTHDTYSLHGGSVVINLVDDFDEHAATSSILQRPTGNGNAIHFSLFQRNEIDIPERNIVLNRNGMLPHQGSIAAVKEAANNPVQLNIGQAPAPLPLVQRPAIALAAYPAPSGNGLRLHDTVAHLHVNAQPPPPAVPALPALHNVPPPQVPIYTGGFSINHHPLQLTHTGANHNGQAALHHGLLQHPLLGWGLPVDNNDELFNCAFRYTEQWIQPIVPGGCFTTTKNTGWCMSCSYRLVNPNPHLQHPAVYHTPAPESPHDNYRYYLHYSCGKSHLIHYHRVRFNAYMSLYHPNQLEWGLSQNNRHQGLGQKWAYVEVVDLFVAMRLSGQLQLPGPKNWNLILRYAFILRLRGRSIQQLSKKYQQMKDTYQHLFTNLFLTTEFQWNAELDPPAPPLL